LYSLNKNIDEVAAPVADGGRAPTLATFGGGLHATPKCHGPPPNLGNHPFGIFFFFLKKKNKYFCFILFIFLYILYIFLL
jgi:hypothetical protein